MFDQKGGYRGIHCKENTRVLTTSVGDMISNMFHSLWGEADAVQKPTYSPLPYTRDKEPKKLAL
jgi:hypothetical protein